MSSESAEYGLSSLMIMSFAHFANHVYIQVHLALIPVFMKEFDLTLSMIGVMLMIPLLFQAIITIPSGLSADKIGHVRQVIFSMILTAAAGVLMTMANSVYFVVASLCVLALSTTVYHPPAYGAVSQMFTRRRSTALGIHGAGGTLGWALGPLSVGAFLVLGWRFVYLLWIPPTLICIPLLIRMKKPEVAPVTHESPGEAQNSIRSVLTVTYSIVLLMLAASSFGRQIVSTFTSPYLVLEKGLDVGTASYLIGAASLAGIVAAPIGGLLADRVGGKRWLTAAYTASIVAFAGFLLSSNFVQLALTAFAYQFCVYSGMGASSALTARFTPAARRGMGYALFFLPSYIVGAAAPFVGGFISDAWGIWNSFIVGIAVLGVAIGILQLIPKD